MSSRSAPAAALTRLARFVSRRRFGILLFWAIVAGILVPQAPHAAHRLETNVRVEGSVAASVEDDLARRFHSPFVQRVLLVVTGIPDPRSPGGHRALERIVTGVSALPGVTDTVSYLDSPEAAFLGRGGTFVIVGVDPGDHPPESLMQPLRRGTQGLQEELRRQYPLAELGWTGEIPLNADVKEASSHDTRAAEKRALPLTLLLLVVAFGSIVAAVLPVATGVLAVLLTLGVSALLARALHLSSFVQNIASMIGLGLGIDYALLMVSRFRESLLQTGSGDRAAEECVPRAGQTLLLCALPVGIGFAALLSVPASDLRPIGFAGILVTFFTLLLALTLLPATLAVLGRRVDAGRLLGPGRARGEARSKRWHRWGDFIVARPWIALTLGAAPLLLLALQATRLKTGAFGGEGLPTSLESVRAIERLEGMGRGNVIRALRLLLDLPPDAPVTSEDGWAATRRLAKILEADPRIERAHSLASIAGAGVTREKLRSLSRNARQGLLSTDERSVLFEVVPAIPSSDLATMRAATEKLARELRAADAAALTGLPGTRLRVGGLVAAATEFEDLVARRFRAVFLLVMAVTFLALFFGFESVLIAAKAVALNLLTVAASFGALVLVFQEGHGAHWFGLGGPTERVFIVVPVLAFCIVFGLSMDYEVFLVSRVREARRGGLAEGPAIVEGLSRTGGVITSAAAIMTAVFAAFALGEFLPIQMLGFTLTVAVLLDATIVRMVIGPALLALAGKWNWWPGERQNRPRPLEVRPT